jgi:NAD+ kinase
MTCKSKISSVGIAAAMHKPEAVRWARQFACRLAELGVAVRLAGALQDHCQGDYGFGDEQYLAESDLVIVLGGDGSLLLMARSAAPLGTPVLGLDVGSFGFLSQDDPQYAFEHLEQLHSGHYRLEERLMLQATVQDSTGRVKAQENALNDAVVSCHDGRRVVSLEAFIDEDCIGDFRADGLIVATPTGSTGYSLSAGGPIVSPQVACMTLTAICPHTLGFRPLVIPAESQVRITVPEGGKRPGAIFLTIDGQQQHEVGELDSVIVTRAPYTVKLARMQSKSYVANLVDKLMSGLRQ